MMQQQLLRTTTLQWYITLLICYLLQQQSASTSLGSSRQSVCALQTQLHGMQPFHRLCPRLVSTDDIQASMGVAVLQFSLLNGSAHDQWLQQKREGAQMDEDSRLACEVLRSRKAGRVSLGLLHLSWCAHATLCSIFAS